MTKAAAASATSAMPKRAAEKVVIADVVKVGEKIVIPENMEFNDAIDVLKRCIVYESETVTIIEPIDAFPWDGAIALREALEWKFGFAMSESVPSFFGGKQPPKEITIPNGVGTTTRAPWGRFLITPQHDREKGFEDYIYTSSTTSQDGRLMFQITAEVRRLYAPVVTELANKVREIVRARSIYKGKAITLTFADSDARGGLHMPEFFDVNSVDLSTLVYTKEIEHSLGTNVLTLLTDTDACREARIPLKRGCLLAGRYGTGKTLFAYKVARVATECGWTMIYIRDVARLAQAIAFARQYQPCVVFAEDIDRVAGTETPEDSERTPEIDNLLSALDGVDAKDSEILVVLTTNNVASIHPSFLRPGRMDVVVEVTPPDAEAVERLVRTYGRGVVGEDADLREVGHLLAGQNAAVVREVVERAKLETIARTGRAGESINGEDLAASARSMLVQQKLLTPMPRVDEHPAVAFVDHIVSRVTAAPTVEAIDSDVQDLMRERDLVPADR